VSCFRGCTSLININIPNNVTSIVYGAFYGCTSLININIPNNVTSIDDKVFYGCTSLTNVTIGNGVTSIGKEVFEGCTSLTVIDVATANQNYSSSQGVLYNKDKTILIKCPIQKAGALTIPNSVTSIGDKVFYGCTGLTSITVGNGVTSIGEEAFYGCTGLTNITIGNNVQTIKKDAFRGCSKLTVLTIPANVTNIELGFTNQYGVRRNSTTFEGCASLTAIDVAPANTSYSSDQGVLYNKDKTTLFKYPVKKTGAYTIPNSVKTIDINAFYECTGLTGITLPNGVEIGLRAFAGCTSLTSITFQGSWQWLNGVYSENTLPYAKDLMNKYNASGPGTYTRPNGQTETWTKK